MFGTTNLPNKIDPAVIRRFVLFIYIKLLLNLKLYLF